MSSIGYTLDAAEQLARAAYADGYAAAQEDLGASDTTTTTGQGDEATAPERLVFLAAFPAIQSAIKVTGDGGGARIQLDIPESEMPAIVRLMLLRNVVLRVTVEPNTVKESSSNGGPEAKPRAARSPIDMAVS